MSRTQKKKHLIGDGDWSTCVLEGPTFLLGTFIWKPSSGSFFPLRAGSSCGSTPRSQSAQVSRTDTIILELDIPQIANYQVTNPIKSNSTLLLVALSECHERILISRLRKLTFLSLHAYFWYTSSSHPSFELVQSPAILRTCSVLLHPWRQIPFWALEVVSLWSLLWLLPEQTSLHWSNCTLLTEMKCGQEFSLVSEQLKLLSSITKGNPDEANTHSFIFFCWGRAFRILMRISRM